ncbi:lipopolysaccharide-induced tumor necrosis factor-alpha factor homolog [Neodiprion virginianus]|uniref:lipopolysaccharide-induced tumor necrosis factor-alpha factor homolog n=1 Tax=Neodiprion virginianus TaxID=2961670 RepID=UPI001EE6DBAF|nr:lipopolysaccharide-induced tumor necrosis factor-alpha factor homolog [Neodiprion virginianus]XP_046603658.1 lipopolysaccharide-induced tumor necrosis factor-alpha factor homolog [Neodiprion virginianus]XP_046603659.1 lipopolysaccharide-induced tumor necrosis factor-alpha factor homolog [Neodiprion virginianus]
MDKDPPPPGFINQQPPPYSPPTEQPTTTSVPLSTLPPYTEQPLYHLHGANVTAHVITQQPGTTVHVITNASPFGPDPITMICSKCNRTVSSVVIKQPTTRTHLWACLLCIFGCWPCAPIVYCTESCLDTAHYCPNCKSYQGKHRR